MSSAILSLISISSGRLLAYSKDPWTALEQMSSVVGFRMLVETVAIWLCTGGAAGSLFSLFVALFVGGNPGHCTAFLPANRL
jgi:hypothetical protein